MPVNINEKYRGMLFLADTMLAVGVFVIRGESQNFSVLVSRRKVSPEEGRFILPGGMVKEGETLRNAARRELMEETGLDARNSHLYPLLGSWQVFLKSEKAYHNYNFVTLWNPEMGEPKTLEPEKHADWHWESIEGLLGRLKRYELSQSLQLVMERLIENSERPQGSPRKLFAESFVWR